ncbi:hypothetical protein AAVH_19101 [Aphelenchoides avenae]|nr:hypothetical protein AAVH_19101 [Aphelenchus avenae]
MQQNRENALNPHIAAQRFSLTLDTGAQNFVLFSKGYASTLRPLCGKGDMQRKLFDPSLSRTLKLTNEPSGALLRAYPYVGLECHKSVGSEIMLYGVRATDTYQIGSVSVPEVPFVLSNRTTHPLNPQWASDGVLPLGLAQYISGDGAIRTVLDALGGKQEVSVFLGK